MAPALCETRPAEWMDCLPYRHGRRASRSGANSLPLQAINQGVGYRSLPISLVLSNSTGIGAKEKRAPPDHPVMPNSQYQGMS